MIPIPELDNPAWSALTTAQAVFARGADTAKRYDPAVLPFVGFASPAGAEAPAELDHFIMPGEAFYIIGELPPLPNSWKVELELPCAQLLAPEFLLCLPQPKENIVKLGEEDKDEMYRLINGIQPGYYRPDTRQLGDYYGIRQGGKLVAMVGERMRMTGYSELSAICTEPDFTGRGYSQQLISYLCRKQVAAHIAPFLHVSLTNQRALRLYIHLGFRHRRDIVFRRIRKIA
jgi:ribosomal protein S18 acetylase RimI-like enzyme